MTETDQQSAADRGSVCNDQLDQDERTAYAAWLSNTAAPALRRIDSRGAHAAGYAAGVAAERQRWRYACEEITRDLRNHDMVRLGAAKCIDRALKA